MPFDAEITTKSRDLIVLEKARERIARGWCQGQQEDHTGAVCIVGAIGYAVRDDGFCEGVNCNHWIDLLGVNGALWNDAPGRTQAQVLARFDEAIAKLRG